MRIASQSDIRSWPVSGMSRPSRRFRSSISSGFPASMRVLHHAPPPVAMRATRSPSRTPFFRNSVTAPLARWACWCVRCTSSNMITNVRPRVSSRVKFVETRGLTGGAVDGAAGTWIASNCTMVWALPSSLIWMSPCLMSVRGFPFLSVTTTSTTTCSIPAGKVSVWSGFGVGVGSGRAVWPGGAGGGGSDWGDPGPGASRKMSPIARNLCVMTSLHLDQYLPVLDPSRVAGDLELSVDHVLSRRDVESPAVPGAGHLLALEETLPERPPPVQAGVADRVENAGYVEDGQGLARDRDLPGLAGRQVAHGHCPLVLRHPRSLRPPPPTVETIS